MAHHGDRYLSQTPPSNPEPVCTLSSCSFCSFNRIHFWHNPHHSVRFPQTACKVYPTAVMDKYILPRLFFNIVQSDYAHSQMCPGDHCQLSLPNLVPTLENRLEGVGDSCDLRKMKCRYYKLVVSDSPPLCGRVCVRLLAQIEGKLRK